MVLVDSLGLSVQAPRTKKSTPQPPSPSAFKGRPTPTRPKQQERAHSQVVNSAVDGFTRQTSSHRSCRCCADYRALRGYLQSHREGKRYVCWNIPIIFVHCVRCAIPISPSSSPPAVHFRSYHNVLEQLHASHVSHSSEYHVR